MVTNKLPVVIKRGNCHRIVAVEYTTQHESNHAEHITVSIGEDEPVYIKCVAEVVKLDSLGDESWERCNFDDGARQLLREDIRSALTQKSVTKDQPVQTDSYKKSKTSDIKDK